MDTTGPTIDGLHAPFVLVLLRHSPWTPRLPFTWSGYPLEWVTLSPTSGLACPPSKVARAGDGKTVLLEGPAILGDRIVTARDLARLNQTAEDIKNSLRGSFTLLIADKIGIGVCHDVLGLSQIYYLDLGTAVLVSNDPHLAVSVTAQLGHPRPEILPSAIVDLVAFCGMTREVGPYSGMSRVPLDRSLYLDLVNGDTVIRENPSPAFLSHCARRIDYQNARDKVIDDILANLRAIRAFYSDTTLVCDLSGGRDSRTVLGALIAAGMHRDVVFSTRYGPGSADTTVAIELASRYGLALCEQYAPLGAGRAELMLRARSTLAGLRIASGAHRLPSNPYRVVNLSGGCGGLGRIVYPGRIPETRILAEVNPEQLHASMFRPSHIHRILNEDGTRLARSDTRPDIDSAPTKDVADIVYLYYLRYRNRTHFGLLSRVMSPCIPVLFPLYSPHLIDLNLQLTTTLRTTDAASLDLIRALEPTLVNHRYAIHPVAPEIAQWLQLHSDSECLTAAMNGDQPLRSETFTWHRLVPEPTQQYPWQSDAKTLCTTVLRLIRENTHHHALLRPDELTRLEGQSGGPMQLAETLWQTLTIGQEGSSQEPVG